MSTPPKALEHMSKNLTAAERQLRQQAEEGVIPDRGRESSMEKPDIMTKNAAASRYWRKVLERMEGLAILDDLDSDALGVYCVVGMEARFKPVEVVYRGESFVLVRSTAESNQETLRLRPGDEVIISANDLYDGKVVGNN